MLATTEVWLRVPRTMLDAMRGLAKDYGVTRSAVLRRALELYLAEHTDWKPEPEGGLP